MCCMHIWNSRTIKMIAYFQVKRDKETCLEEVRVDIFATTCCTRFYFTNET